MSIYSIDGITPVIHPSSYVHPAANIIGDVIIGQGCYIAPGVSLRGDCGRITVGDESNIQDNCVLHTLPGADTIVESNGHIGHGAVLHGCTIKYNAMIGINAIILDEVVIGESSIVGAGAFIKTGFQCPPRSLILGTPGKVVRELTDEEVEWKSSGTMEYKYLTTRCLNSLIEVEPLVEMEPGRKHFDSEDFQPLNNARKK